MARISFNELAHLTGDALPTAILRRSLGASLKDLGCALCLHRAVPATRPTDWQEGLNMAPSEIDTLIELLLASRPGGGRWLTITFDDGYADSAEYLRTRAPHFPDVEFLFFVCLEKLERRVGFRWDLVELALRDGVPRSEAMALLAAPMEIAQENSRAELGALAEHPDFRLATLEELAELSRFPNVGLGNHTDLHAPAMRTAPEVVSEDYRRSTELFTRRFGAPRHFAFPFGTPRFHFTGQQVEVLRSLGDFVIWSTEGRPFRLDERRPRAVLPRFPVNGSKSAAAVAGLIAARSLKYRVQGTPHRF